jgi:signal transduction histidine kinase
VLVAFQALAVLIAFGALMRARRDAKERERLMAELESAHGELRRYADRVRDLTVATERTRMAREMHDSVGHYLTVINLLGRRRPGVLEHGGEEAVHDVERLG